MSTTETSRSKKLCGATYQNPVIKCRCEMEEGHEGAHHDVSCPGFDFVWTTGWASVIRV